MVFHKDKDIIAEIFLPEILNRLEEKRANKKMDNK